jgi:hypothetical protein
MRDRLKRREFVLNLELLMMYRISTLSADQSIEIRLSQDIDQILAVQGFEVLVSGSQDSTSPII